MAKTIQELLTDNPPADAGPSTQPIRYVDTVEAYDKWAEVYDTDGNFLQRLDTIEMRALLPRFLDRVNAHFQSDRHDNNSSRPLTLVDMGCGTGRNTLQLMNALSSPDLGAENLAAEYQIVGLDASPGMLEVASRAIYSVVANNNNNNNNDSDSAANAPTTPKKPSPKFDIRMDVLDLLQFPSANAHLPPPLCDPSFSGAGVISTLVLEHIPAKQFFAAASALMAPGAYLLVTNMHADMGSRSQAGFTDPTTGVKIRPTSYYHTLPEVLSAAHEVGFAVEEDLMGSDAKDGVLVREVDERLGEALGSRAKKWVGVKVWFGVCFRKRRR